MSIDSLKSSNSFIEPVFIIDDTPSSLKFMIESNKERKDFGHELHQDFVCDNALFAKNVKQLDQIIDKTSEFDTQLYLSGFSTSEDCNIDVMENSQIEISKLVEKIRTEQKTDLDLAYKKTIGLIDSYDEAVNRLYKHDKTLPKSTFAIRTALLHKAQNDGVNIDSWMVYTKGGKPSVASNQLWTFLDDWKNWTPESQGKFAKFSEITKVKSKKLSTKHQEKQVVLFKGGFGSGKTRLSKQLFGKNAQGRVAPDTAKDVTRRSSPQISHSTAHIEGSQVAYQLFDGLIKELDGTIAYDSSLKNPRDIKDYISKIKNSKSFDTTKDAKASGQPKLIIYDLARKDKARFLAVLRRSVTGEDPRIPPGMIMHSAISEKLSRHQCMQVVQEETELDVEYHFFSGNNKGWDTQKVATISSEKIEVVERYSDRASLEGIKIDTIDKSITSTNERSKLKEKYHRIFQKNVKTLMEGVSGNENEANQATFEKRILISALAVDKTINTVDELYDALDEKVKETISKENFEQAMKTIPDESFRNLLTEVNTTKKLSYLELPFVVASSIHCKLKNDPWN